MSNRNQTRWHNLDFLKTNLRFSQLGNSIVFQKNGKYFLSPAVSEGKHGKYWIDIREANLKKVDLKNCFLLPRIVPDLFILESIPSLNNLLSKNLMENRAHSGNVWGIYMELNLSKSSVTLASKRKSRIKITTKLIAKKTIIETIRRIYD